MDTFTSWRNGITPEQMREIDQLAESGYGLTSSLLMEAAGLAVARVARKLVQPPLSERAIVILAGPGNNGGDGLVAARRLAGWGAAVTVHTTYEVDHARGPSRAQLERAGFAGLTVGRWAGPDLATQDLIIDAVLGFGASGAPRGVAAEMILAANAGRVAVLAVDSPSGLDAGSGLVYEPCIRAAATVTLALPKTGLLTNDGPSVGGRLFLADIGIPRPLLAEIGVDGTGLFAEHDLIELNSVELRVDRPGGQV